MSNRLTISSVALVLTLSAPIAMAADNEQRGISASVAADLLYQLETLQFEVSQLRGKLEEQEHELRKMKALQKDRYIDLDKRISAAMSVSRDQVSVQPSVASAGQDSNNSTSSIPVAVAVPTAQIKAETYSSPSESAKQAYDSAYQLIKQKEFEQARSKFRSFVSQYPNNQLTGNAHYWLGELALVLGNQGEALVQFKSVVDSFPGHPKVPDAVYKLGIVNDQMGNQALAKTYLQQVINEFSNANAAKLSTNYLNNMK